MAEVLIQPDSFNSISSLENAILITDMKLEVDKFNSDSDLLLAETNLGHSTIIDSLSSTSAFEITTTIQSVNTRLDQPLIAESSLLEITSRIEKSFISSPPSLISNSKFNNAEHYIEGGVLIPLDEELKSESELEEPIIFGGEGFSTSLSSPFSSNSEFLLSELKYNIMEFMDTGDDVYLLIIDDNTKFKVYKGKIRNLNPKDRKINLKAIMGDKILTERIIKEDYLEQDIGQTVKEVIETYCSPLTAENVNTNTGYSAPIKAKGKKPSQVLQELQEKYPIVYFVDFAWDFHFLLESEIQKTDEEIGGYFIRLGDK